MTDLEKFTGAFFDALYFFDAHHPDAEETKDAELSDETRLNLEADCRSFWWRFGCYITCDACEGVGYGGDPVAQAGHDFWLTRQGHGAGFWDGDWPSPYDDILAKGSRQYGEVGLYLGDDGEIWA
jgi:hypothetical protein